MGAGAVPGALAGTWKLIPHAGCLAQHEYKGRCLVLWKFDVLCFADTHGKPPFLNEFREGVH